MEYGANCILRRQVLYSRTPINPTYKAYDNDFKSLIKADKIDHDIANNLKKAGYRVIVSVGDLEENLIGSNCGQFLMTHLKALKKLKDGYTKEC
jgi:23S rRNA (adenine2503-C2)-methyltransferase